MIKTIIFILISYSFLLSDEKIISPNKIIKIDKKKNSNLFKQARALEKNGLFDEAKLIYKNILFEDPINKIAFNKIKIILLNEKDFDSLKEIAERYQKNQINNPKAQIDLVDIYLISNDERWKAISDEIFNKNIENDFLIKGLLNKILEVDYVDYAKSLINFKRQQKDKQAFYSFEMGNYYISRLNYNKAILEFLIFLDKNPNQYNKISNKIIAIPDYVDLQQEIKETLYKSSFLCSKILLSDIAFKSKDFKESYDLLKNNFQTPNQLLDFAYQNKKIKNYDLAIEVYKDIINQDYSSKMTISAILDMGDTLEKKSISSKLNLPISQYFYNNEILMSPYNYINSENLGVLDGAISLYDSLYSISKGSEAGFRLAEIQFTILNDLDRAFDIYTECIKYSKNTSIKFNSSLRIIDIMIIKGNLSEAKKILVENIKQYGKGKESNLLAIKNIQIDFFNMEESILDSISNVTQRLSKDNFLYNDLLDMQSIIISFKDDLELLELFSQAQLLIFQNKRLEAIKQLIEIHNYSIDNMMINDFIIAQLSYLLLLENNFQGVFKYLDEISHETIFSEFSYILKAEIFDFILDDKKNAVDLYLDFLNKYPLSIFYDDIRLRLRDLVN